MMCLILVLTVQNGVLELRVKSSNAQMNTAWSNLRIPTTSEACFVRIPMPVLTMLS